MQTSELTPFVVLAAIFALGCDRPASTPPLTPEAVPIKVPEHEPAAIEAPFLPLPEERPFDEASVQQGLERVDSCKTYETYVRNAMVDFHLRDMFWPSYGRSFGLKSGLPRFGAPARDWAVDGPRAFEAFNGRLFVINAESGASESVESRMMYGPPALQGAARGVLFVGRSSFFSSPNNAGFRQFRRGTRVASAAHHRGGAQTRTYRQYQHTKVDLYAPSESSAKLAVTTRIAGELLGVHVSPSNTAYVVTLTEPHITAKIAETAQDVTAPTAEAAEEALRKIKVDIADVRLPAFTWQVQASNADKRDSSRRFDCKDFFVPQDPDTVGQRLLLVHPFDLDSLQYGEPIGIAVEKNSFRAAFSGDRLLLARRLHGGMWPDGTMDRPLTELNVFDMSDAPKLAETHQLDGVPVEVLASASGGVIVTTRGPDVERLTYSIIDGKVDAEPRRHRARLDPDVRGEVGSFVWKTGLAFDRNLIFAADEFVVSVTMKNDGVEFETFTAEGSSLGTAHAANVLRFDADELIVLPSGFLLPTHGPSGATTIAGRLSKDGLTISEITAPADVEPRTLQGEQVLAVGSERAVWLPLKGGEPTREVKWSELKPTADANP